MVLSNDSNACSGSYFYVNYKKPIFLYGTCKNSKINLQEQEENYHFPIKAKSNRIVGDISNGVLTGTWQSSDNKTSYALNARQVVPNKNDILKDAKGKYLLSSISGFYGANTMTDIFKENGSWHAGGSGISDGMRQGFDVDLSKDERHILSSFKLVTNESLGILIYCKGNIIAEFPFLNESIFDVKSITKKDDDIGRIYKYDKAGSFIENVLHIATTDKYSFSEYMPFENTPIDNTHAISIDYNPITGDFEVKIIDSQCCGATVLYFKKHNK